ncbi:MAG: hypothetical protein HKN23_04230 [Verrucomicrobiales bacterium]|nr:hypothetical protein [Verrucomicrobiales bacterium]
MAVRTFPASSRESVVEFVKNLVRYLPLSKVLKEKLLFYGKMGFWPNFDEPRTFSEKINWRKLYSSNSVYIRCSDKLAVRDHVRQKIGEQYLIPVLYSGDSITAEQILELGDNIVVKANHDSGSTCIIEKNTPEKAAEVAAKVQRMLKTDFGRITNQWWYSKIPRRVYVEKMIPGDETGVPCDYKFFVFKQPDGQPSRILIEIDYGRGTSNHHRTFYDGERNIVEHLGQPIQIDDKPNLRTPFPGIDNYDEMKQAVLTLAEDFDHVRIDMYEAEGKIYFGEMTFSDGGGRSRCHPHEFDYVMGDLWMLNREPGGPERPDGVESNSPKSKAEQMLRATHRNIRTLAKKSADTISAGFERTLRFFSLPYAMVCLVEWNECKRNPILVFWDHLYIFFVLKYFPDNYASCRLWEVDRKEWKYYYGTGYDPRAIRRRSRKVMKPEYSIVFEDKEVCYHLCESFNLPLPVQYGAISPEDDFAETVRDIFKNHDAKRLVIKLVDGAGGKGTCIVQKEPDQLVVRQISDPTRAIMPENHSVSSRAVIQEWVNQHPDVSRLSGRALNTVRMVTMLTPEKDVIVIGAYIRIGIGSNFLDSGNHGGVGARVDVETGRLGERTSDGRGRAIPFKPDAHEKVSDVVLPDWEEAKTLAVRVQKLFGPFNRFIGMDIGFSENGPVLVEVNDIFDCGRFESVTGPILKNEKVLKACQKYGLITHNRLK